MNYYQKPKDRYQENKQADEFRPDEQRINKILGGDAQEMNTYAEELARHFLSGRDQEKLSTSQIRTILSEIQKMKKYDKNQVQLLRPKLAYAAGRHRGRFKDFYTLFEAAVKQTNEKNFKMFQNFIEAIVAYHKFQVGK